MGTPPATGLFTAKTLVPRAMTSAQATIRLDSLPRSSALKAVALFTLHRVPFPRRGGVAKKGPGVSLEGRPRGNSVRRKE